MSQTPSDWQPPYVLLKTSLVGRILSLDDFLLDCLIIELCVDHVLDFGSTCRPILIIMCSQMQGNIVVELYWKHAPLTCKNFAELAQRKYYNNTKFHRIIKA